MDLQTAHGKLRERIGDIKRFCATGSPLVFVLACACLDYLSKLAWGKDRGSQGYKDFVTGWLSRVRRDYDSFRFSSGETDLPVQMYHVLRCGIVHSFSLVPDKRARHKGGRDRSIVLFHRKESQDRGLSHLSNYCDCQVADAAAFVAEDFVEDLEQVIEALFAEAGSDPKLRANMESWLQRYPLITGQV